MFKKWMACVISVLMLVCLMNISVAAGPDDTVTFTLSVSEGSVGDTVTVSVSVPEQSRLTNTMMYLHYNPDAVSYVADSIGAGSASPKSGTMFDAMDHKDKYYVKAAYITGNVVVKGGVLLTFDFEVLSAIPAAFSLSFDECQGEAEDGTMFDMKNASVGCVLNNDGNVSAPTGEAVYTTTTVTPPTVTTVTDPMPSDAPSTQPAVTTTMPTMIVTDEGNNKITIPVVSETDAAGNVTTKPVVVVTNAQGTTVTVPVVIITNPDGTVETLPVADGVDENGNDVTIPVAIVTDPEGNIETVPVATATDANGSLVTVPVTTSATQPTEKESDGNSSLLTLGIVGGCLVLAVIIAVAAMKLRKKNEE